MGQRRGPPDPRLRGNHQPRHRGQGKNGRKTGIGECRPVRRRSALLETAESDLEVPAVQVLAGGGANYAGRRPAARPGGCGQIFRLSSGILTACDRLAIEFHRARFPSFPLLLRLTIGFFWFSRTALLQPRPSVLLVGNASSMPEVVGSGRFVWERIPWAEKQGTGLLVGVSDFPLQLYRVAERVARSVPAVCSGSPRPRSVPPIRPLSGRTRVSIPRGWSRSFPGRR